MRKPTTLLTISSVALLFCLGAPLFYSYFEVATIRPAYGLSQMYDVPGLSLWADVGEAYNDREFRNLSTDGDFTCDMQGTKVIDRGSDCQLSANPGHAVYGPYIKLMQGTYSANISLTTNAQCSGGIGTLTVRSDSRALGAVTEIAGRDQKVITALFTVPASVSLQGKIELVVDVSEGCFLVSDVLVKPTTTVRQ